MSKRKVSYTYLVIVILSLILLSILPFLRTENFFESSAKAVDDLKNPAFPQAEFVPDEIIVKFKKGVKAQKINELISIYNTKTKSINPILGFMLLKVRDKGVSIQELARRFRNNREVEYAEPNYLVHICLHPDDPYYPDLWGLNNTGQTGGLPDVDIDAPEAWDINTGDPSVIVAVIDTGIDYNHEDLSSNIWTNPGEIPDNGIDDDGNGYIDDVKGWDFVNGDNDPMDDSSHGTHCAGTIAAIGNNGVGVVGVNWAAKLMTLKFLNASGKGTTSDAILAIQYATQMGAKVMNNSWGGGGYSQAFKDAITAAYLAGIVFVASAGNDGTNNDVIPYYPASYDVPNVIAVAAINHNNELAWFSNYGSYSVDLGAPGENILSTFPNNDYGYKDGTSMAAPHVAGVSALLLAEYPVITIEEIKQRIIDSAVRIPSLRGKTVSEGRLNAYGALIGAVPPPPPVPVTVFYDDMENGINGWVSDGSLWHQSSHRSASPVTSWYYGIEGAYNYNTGGRNYGSLTSPPIDLTDIISSKLVLTHFLETENSPPYDTGKVRITKDGGITYKDILSTITTDGGFIEQTIDISEFDGYIIQIQFFFDTLDSLNNNFEGWYIDDVVIEGESLNPPVNQPPVSDAGPDKSAYVGDTVVFDGSGSYDPDGSIISYDWDFGDGSPNGTGITTSHIYSASGTYIVTLTVTDNGGLTDADSCNATISEMPSNTMHVEEISMSLTDTKRGKNIFTSATATILIHDSSEMPVSGATVSGHWSGLTSDQDSGLTDTDGKVSLDSDTLRNPSGTFTFTVDDLFLEGWTYDPSANEEASDSIVK